MPTVSTLTMMSPMTAACARLAGGPSLLPLELSAGKVVEHLALSAERVLSIADKCVAFRAGAESVVFPPGRHAPSSSEPLLSFATTTPSTIVRWASGIWGALPSSPRSALLPQPARARANNQRHLLPCLWDGDEINSGQC